MSTRITYASFQHNTWVYRRTYPRHLQPLLGSSLKQSLKTTDVRVAKARVEELNATFAKVVSEAEASLRSPESLEESQLREDIVQLSVKRPRYSRAVLCGDRALSALSPLYLELQSKRLRQGSFKSVRFSVELLVSHIGATRVSELSQQQGLEVLALIAKLSPNVRKYRASYGLSLSALAHLSSEVEGTQITPQTQRRIWDHMLTFIDWAVKEENLDVNQWRKLKVANAPLVAPHVVLSDVQASLLLQTTAHQGSFHGVVLFGLFAGMRSGEICGLTWGDIQRKGNLGRFVVLRPNQHRLLKSRSAERDIPLHPMIEAYLDRCDPVGDTAPLFPQFTVDRVVKAYAKLRDINHSLAGTVFHSTRKWFVTQCERTGTPEHFTASIVGHASARSANKLTYGLYSGGISDEQKRLIVDAIQVPQPL